MARPWERVTEDFLRIGGETVGELDIELEDHVSPAGRLLREGQPLALDPPRRVGLHDVSQAQRQFAAVDRWDVDGCSNQSLKRASKSQCQYMLQQL